MEEIGELLSSLDMSKVEVDTYLAILRNGPVGAGRVAKLTQNYRANVYQAIERLKSKGFISETSGKNSRLFEALSPGHLLNDLKRKSESLEKMIPALESMRSTSMATTSMRVIEGINGWKHLLEEFIETGEERVVYGIPKGAELLKDFLGSYHRERARKRMWLRHLFNYDARYRIKETNKLPFTESRYLPEELSQPASTSVCGPLVALTFYQGRDTLTFVIENRTIADSYRKHFDFLWKMAKS